MKRNAITIAITLLSASAIFGALAYNGSQMPSQETQPKATSAKVAPAAAPVVSVSTLQQVAVQTATAGSYQAQVTGYGEARPRFELSYTSEVSGRVESISDAFETGQVVAKGTVLATLDDASYQQAVTQAEADVASAHLALLEEQRQGQAAKSEWERSGLEGEPDSPLVLREPQLVKAKATLANAKKALEKAKQDLANTVIKAPFDALIVSRDIQPGSYVQGGGALASLYSTDRVEVEVPLSETQWRNLPETASDAWQVTLTSSDGSQQWQGYVARSEKHLQQNTRTRSLVVVVEKPLEQTSPLYPGTFVSASIRGVERGELWELPASAISQQGELWLVDDKGLLTPVTADKQFEVQDKVYVTPVEGKASAQVVKRPLSSFQTGMSVSAVVEG